MTSRPTSSPRSARTLEAITRNEGKPEQALPKIVEGRLQGFYKTVALLDQPYAKDDKQSIAQLIGSATITEFARSRSADADVGGVRRRAGHPSLAAHRLQAVR